MRKRTLCGDPHVVHGNLEQIGILFDMFEDIGFPVTIFGDLFDTKEILRAKCFNYVHKRLKESKLHYTILVGNHDWFNLDCKEHSLETLKALPNVTIVDKPTVEDGILYVPYYDDLDSFKKVLKETKAKVLFMHQGVVGFDYGNGHLADGNGHGEIDSSITTGFVRVISGHFHKFAQDGNLTFLGTPFSHDFGETDQLKYIGIYDLDTDELELLETPFPRHRTLDLDVGDSKEASKVLKKFVNEKDIFRVNLIGTEMEISAFDQSKWARVKFIDQPTDADQIEGVVLKDTDSNEQKFLSWAKEIKGLDENTIKLGLELLGEAK